MLLFQEIQMLGLFLQIGNQILDGIFPDKGFHLLRNDLGLDTQQPFYEAHQILMNHAQNQKHHGKRDHDIQRFKRDWNLLFLGED